MDSRVITTLAAQVRSFHGLFFSIVSAFLSEAVLSPFLATQRYLPTVGRMAILFIAFYTIHRFALTTLRNYRPLMKDLSTLMLVLFGSVCLIWVGRVLSVSVASYGGTSQHLGDLSSEALYFAIPFTTGALLIQALLGFHYGLVFALCLSTIVGMYFPAQPMMSGYVLTTSLAACLSLSKFRSRSAYLRAGLNVAIISFAIALASLIAEPGLIAADVGARLIGSFAGGVISVFLAAGLTPVVEYLGGYVTDMRLIEMATLDHPLLKELSIQAPGTWNHSMVMGMMVEQAADAVGANSIVARVGAYFHDIGKSKKPLYFVENQGGGENRHDRLSTSMSALIIRSHVKDGLDLARKHKLPPVMEDMILQHHGTSLIEYFYEKAKKELEESGADPTTVDQSLYTYPGPKPQTREAGILMLADGIEAAARTLSEPSLDRIQGMVQKMINKVFASGQLNECELTLKDLNVIAKSFIRVLNGIYHQRVAYSEPAEKVHERKEDPDAHESDRKDVEGGGTSKKGRQGAEDKSGKEASKEDLKRLGL